MNTNFRSRFVVLSLLLLLLSTRLAAQTYPVQLSVQLQPPFSGYLPDYSTPGSEQFNIFVLFTDFSRPSYDIKLKFRLQGQGITIANPAYFYAGPFTVEPGVPLRLSGSDLAPLIAQQNLTFSGITTQQYNQRRVLPEGFYTVCVTAFDYLNPTPIQVSNEACTQAWMLISDPPLLNFPACGSTVPELQPQQLTFSWTPLNMGGPSSALGTEYVLRLWEIRPAGNVPGNVMVTSPPVDSIVTSLTMVNYGLFNYPLIAGMEYVWTVQARDLDGRELFRNQGRSAPCTFVYGNALSAAAGSINLNLTAQLINHRQARLRWDSAALFSSYRLEYRAQNVSPNWLAVNTPQVSTRITDLAPERTYEARVRGVLPDGSPGAWSDVVVFSTPAQQLVVCGQTAPAPPMQNYRPLTVATPGMIWQVGQFELVVTQLQQTANAQGYYSGLGKMVMLGGIGVRCSFQNIRMGEDLVMVAGEVHALTDGITNWLSQMNASGMPAPEITVTTVIENAAAIAVDTAAGTVVINGQSFSYETEEGTAIADANGALWVVTSNGTVVFAGQSGAIAPGLINDYIHTVTGSVVFSNASTSLYGFDAWVVPAWRLYYRDVTDKKDNAVKAVSWKSVQTQKYDEVLVQLSLAPGIHPDSVFFFSRSGTRYTSHGTGLLRRFYVVGGADEDRQEIYAGYFFAPDSVVNIGKVNVVSLAEQEKKLHLVALTSGATPAPQLSAATAQALQTQLNSVFAGGVCKWRVVVDAPLVATGWDADLDGKLKVGGTGLSRYSEEMKSINALLRARPGYASSEEYLLVSGLLPDSAWSEAEGVMPRGKNMGYVFADPVQPVFLRTAAHELAHGVFALEHSFVGNAPAPKASTDNLLDYSATGTRLVQWQWAWMNNPSLLLGIGDDDDESLSLSVLDIEELAPFKNGNGTYTLLTPAGHYFTLPSQTEAVAFSTYDALIYTVSGSQIGKSVPIGALTRFTVAGKNYRANYTDSEFLGYYEEDAPATALPYNDPYSGVLQPASAIVVIPGVEEHHFVGYAGKYAGPVAAGNQVIHTGAGPLKPDMYIIPVYDNAGSAQAPGSLKTALTAASTNQALITIYSLQLAFPKPDVNVLAGQQTPSDFVRDNLSATSSIADHVFCFTLANLNAADLQAVASCLAAAVNQQAQVALSQQQLEAAKLRVNARVFSEQHNLNLADYYQKQAIIEKTTFELARELYPSVTGQPQYITNIIAALDQPQTTTTALHNVFAADYRPCLFVRLTLNDRIRALNKLLQNPETWMVGTNNLLLDLLRNMPVSDRPGLLKQGFLVNNAFWIRTLLDRSEESNYLETTAVLYEITPWIYQTWEALQVPVTFSTLLLNDVAGLGPVTYPAGVEPFYFGITEEGTYTVGDQKTITFTTYNNPGTQVIGADGKVHLRQTYTYNDAFPVVGMPAGYTPVRSFERAYTKAFHPFEMVTIMNRDANGVYQSIILPAFMVVVQAKDAALTEAVARREAFLLRATVDLVVVATAILTAPETGGTSLAVATEVINLMALRATLGDIVIQGIRVTDPGNNALYEVWDRFFFTVNAATGTVAIVGGLPRIAALLKASEAWNEFSALYRARTLASQPLPLAVVDLYADLTAVGPGSGMYELMNHFYFKMKFNDFTKNPNNRQLTQFNVTIAEEAAIELYVSTLIHAEFNQALAGVTQMTPMFIVFKDLLTKACLKLPTINTVVINEKLYRGTGVDESDFARRLVKDSTFTFEGRFTSASVGLDVAGRFLETNGGDVLWEIQSKAGFDNRIINSAEKEIIFLPHTRFQLIDIKPLPTSPDITVYIIEEL